MSSNTGVVCFSVFLCAQSNQDRDTGAYAFFNVIESLGVPESGLGRPVGLEVDSFWLFPDEMIGRSVEFRVETKNVADGTSTHAPEGTIEVVSAQLPNSKIRRSRVRQMGFLVPPTYGDYEIRLNWRNLGEEDWRVGDAFWTLVLAKAPEPVSSVVDAP